MKSIKKKVLLLMVLGALLSNSLIIVQSQQNTTMEKENVFIHVKNDQGNTLESIGLSNDKAYIIKDKLIDLTNQMERGEYTTYVYLEKLLSIFHEAKILPLHFNLKNLQEIAQKLNNLIDQQNYENENQLINTARGSLHIGRGTVIGSIGIGNFLVRRIIPFAPYDFINIFTKKLFLDYNLSSFFSYASACIWTPGPKGHHILYSFISYPGLSALSKKIFVDKAIGGIFILGANISLEAYSQDGQKVLFDATIGVYGSDIMIGFGI